MADTPHPNPPHPVYEAARQVLQRVLDRLKNHSERACLAGERPSMHEFGQHRKLGQGEGLSQAADFLAEEMAKLPK